MTSGEVARTKICGITSVPDALAAKQAGTDAIGLVFYAKSPRNVAEPLAREIALSVGPFVTVVGLFVDAEQSAVERCLQSVPLHVLQFHGSESNEYCRQFQRPFIKAIRMAPGLELEPIFDAYPDAAGFILDAYQPGVPGGTGQRFDWHRFPNSGARPLILAGGLNPENILQALRETTPYGVDVSGGVESAPGVKSAQKVADFIRTVKSVSLHKRVAQ
ncbi:phosphoribosylanthranilate isomerase [Halioxenophilus sp. WMMB6]|uniref:phosphoribosylanthranilate isomerase n=1 Tax=Halioxenophilus sp. WMMB6 TaxID=3073815 RepID=UPI00295EC02D|nr:phosphoribosylanthranilate isomerase [Halioxenophilus sp. WMMB6]